jgi:hypothetical protein
MNGFAIAIPESKEYAPYYGIYISLVEGNDILSALKKQMPETQEILTGISEETGLFRYAEDKWSIKELVGHLIDTERIMAYRALRFARNDKIELEGFEQNDYIVNSNFDDCSLSDLAREFELVREANILMLQNFSEEAWSRSGIASGNNVSVRALAYIIAGHELHHINILKQRYL